LADDIEIRKAFEVVLKNALAAYSETVAVDWPNEGFDDTDKTIYVKPRLGDVSRLPKTLGDNPAVHTDGYFSIGCYLKQGERQDRLDLLVKAVAAAYPYDTDLSAGGGVIMIRNVRSGGLLTPPKWAYRPVDITWSMEI
jgi:hypothetical protein